MGVPNDCHVLNLSFDKNMISEFLNKWKGKAKVTSKKAKEFVSVGTGLLDLSLPRKIVYLCVYAEVFIG